jgi:hypothetical protein
MQYLDNKLRKSAKGKIYMRWLTWDHGNWVLSYCTVLIYNLNHSYYSVEYCICIGSSMIILSYFKDSYFWTFKRSSWIMIPSVLMLTVVLVSK